jgi:hypothetical protein
MSGISSSIAIWRVLNVPSVIGLLDGGLYRYNRPINSRKRDVVISTPEQGKVDINIHVPNLVLQDDQTNPDLAQMKVITDAVLSLLSGYDFDKVGLPQRDADGQWLCQIRINYNSVDAGLAVELWSLTRVDDGYGGFTATKALHWSGIAQQVDIKRGSQLQIAAGRYEFNLETDWLLPQDAEPQKFMHLITAGGEYVINGIIPEAGGWRLNTRRKDGAYTA